MQKTKTLALVMLLSLALIPTAIPLIPTVSAATAYNEVNGTLNGANYTLWLPNPIQAWTGGLVMYCHGYSHNEPVRPLIKASDGTATWAGAMISVGSAFAMSSFGAGGYCVEKAMNATYDLTQYIISTYGAKKDFVTVMGVSMGGNIALLLGEKYPNVYRAVLDICGSKGLAQQYRDKIDYAATTNDTQLAAKITAAGGKVPPFPLSMASSNLTGQLAAFRAFCAQSAADIAAEAGGTPDVVPLNYQKFDPVYHANISIPVITVHGTADTLVPYSRSLDYQAAVAAAGKSSLYRLYAVQGGEHGDALTQGVAGAHFTELIAMSIAPVPILQAAAFCNATVIQGWTWCFFVQGTGGAGPYTYQWFEGSTLMQGQTSMVLAVTKNAPGTFVYYCKVTDANGYSVNSNPVWLNVQS